MTDRPKAAATRQLVDPRDAGAKPPYGEGAGEPGSVERLQPQADHGEQSYVGGSGRLAGLVSVITGGDSGIGRAVAIAFAREGADVVIGYLDEDTDAQETCRLVEEAGRRGLVVRTDVRDEAQCNALVERAVAEFGRIDILVNNAATQKTYASLDEITTDDWRLIFSTNVDGPFYLARAAVPHMQPGASIINTASVESFTPEPTLLPYAASKGAILNFTRGLAKMLGPKGIRVNAVCPGPIWTPLIPNTMPPEKVRTFGGQTPLGRAGQPVEVAAVYVFLASPEASYVTGSAYGVHGGMNEP